MVTQSELDALDRVLSQYARSRTGAPSEVDAGTLNRNLQVPTDLGPVFARRYRGELDRDHLLREHPITRRVADRGVPAVVPLARPDGGTVLELDGDRWALFPWLHARSPVRGAMTHRAAAAIGGAHGKIQHTLAEHPQSDGSTLRALTERVAWDTAASIETLSELERRAAEVADAPPRAMAAMSFQRQFLETGAPRPFAEFDWLPCQLLHGDFHDQQVLLNADETVAGVVDWELAQVASRVWELVRSLAFSQVLETDLLEHYLRGYRKHIALTEEERRAGVEFWYQNRLHGTWVYRAYFEENNQRVAEFFAETDRHLRSISDDHFRAQITDRVVAATR